MIGWQSFPIKEKGENARYSWWISWDPFRVTEMSEFCLRAVGSKPLVSFMCEVIVLNVHFKRVPRMPGRKHFVMLGWGEKQKFQLQCCWTKIRTGRPPKSLSTQGFFQSKDLFLWFLRQWIQDRAQKMEAYLVWNDHVRIVCWKYCFSP